MNLKVILVSIVPISIGLFVGFGIIETGKFAIDNFEKITSGQVAMVVQAFDKKNDSDFEEQVQTDEQILDQDKPLIVRVANTIRNPFAKNVSFITDNTGYKKINEGARFPNISADKILINDLETGEIIEFSSSLTDIEKEVIRNGDQPIASITKLMTALVALENIPADDIVTVTKEAVATYGRQGGLSTGDKLSAHDLMYALLLQSSNDAAEALAIHYGRSNFLQLMNSRAKSIGMKKTFYDDASGLSARNTSSVNDLMTLTLYLYNNYPEIIDITDLSSYRSGDFIWYNNSRFRNDDNYIGGKNGYTDEAKNTLVSLFELPLGDNSELRKVAVIILGSDHAEQDMRNIVKYLLKNIEYTSK